MTLRNTIKNIKKSYKKYFNVDIKIFQVSQYNGYDFEEWVFGDEKLTIYNQNLMYDIIKKEGLKVFLRYQNFRDENFTVIKDFDEIKWKQEF